MALYQEEVDIRMKEEPFDLEKWMLDDRLWIEFKFPVQNLKEE